jgi:hypothetical protein
MKAPRLILDALIEVTPGGSADVLEAAARAYLP